MNNKLLILVSLFFMGLSMVPASVHAHGGAAIEFDKCVVVLGKYRMHFTAYQPATGGGTEYCWDLPLPGHSILVFDFVNPEMKTKPAELRVVELGAEGDIGSPVRTLAHAPEKLYETGSVSADVDIEEGKRYVAVLTLSDVRPLVLKAPIQVVRNSGPGGTTLLVGLLLVAAAVSYYFYFFRSKEAKA